MPEDSIYKMPLDVIVYHRGIYYHRFISVVRPTRFLKGRIGYHTYPSTPGVHYNDHRTLWANGIGSQALTHTHSYREYPIL